MLQFFISLFLKVIYFKKIHPLVEIKTPSTKLINIGAKSYVSAFTTIITEKGNTNSPINIKNNVLIRHGVYILSGKNSVEIGDNTQVGSGVKILGGGGIKIGKNVRIGPNVVIASSTHNAILNKKRSEKFSQVIIEDDVFIGANATILLGLKISKGAIIGAGSVVNKDVNRYQTVAGIPAKLLPTNRVSILKAEIETDIDYFLKNVPFHNLFFLYNIDVVPSLYGGTCSDRTKYFKQVLDEKYKDFPINIKYHRAFIKGKETHTILKITLINEVYFIDVGMGYPILKLIPSNANMSFSAFGINFRTIVEEKQIIVQSDILSDTMHELMHFNIESDYCQSEVIKKMNNRYDKPEDLPFSKGLRYMFIQEDTFYEIKHNDSFFEDEKKTFKTHVSRWDNN